MKPTDILRKKAVETALRSEGFRKRWAAAKREEYQQWIDCMLEAAREHGRLGKHDGRDLVYWMEVIIDEHGLPMTWKQMQQHMLDRRGIPYELCDYAGNDMFEHSMRYAWENGEVVEIDIDELCGLS